MTTDDHLAERLQDVGARLVTTLHAMTRAVVLYETNNEAVVRLVDQLASVVEDWRREAGVGAALELQLLPDEAFVNGQLLRVDPKLWERSRELAERLHSLGVGQFRFGERFARDDAVALADALCAALRGQGGLPLGGVGAIGFEPPRGSAIASFRFEPDRLAIWLYTSLLDLSARLFAAHARGQRPSLLPLKRSLQLVVDNMREHGAIYQLLSAVQHPRHPPGEPGRRVAVAVNLVGFAGYLGMSRTERLTLGLGGVLWGLAPKGGPEAIVRELAAYPGLGETAVPLALLLHDARAARRGGEAAPAALLLATVEEYVRATYATEKRPAIAPRRVLEGLRQGRVAWVPRDLAEAFAAWKGPYPLGSLVELRPGGPAVVVGQGEGPRGKRRPVVAPLDAEGRLGPRLDLARERSVEIARALDPVRGGVRLAIHAAAGA